MRTGKPLYLAGATDFAVSTEGEFSVTEEFRFHEDAVRHAV